MADTLVETSVVSNADSRVGLWGPYYINTLKGLILFPDGQSDASFAYTDDGGATWATTEIQDGNATVFAAWKDEETPGDSGTLVHLAWLDIATDDCFYVTIDVDNGTAGTVRTVDATITIDGTLQNNRVAITKTVSGNIMVAFSTQTEIECYKSADNFATAGTAIADVFETATEADLVLLYPANTGDDDDASAIFWDRSASEISVKVYDDSGDSWGETSVSGSMTANDAWMNMDGAVRHSDSHILFAAHSAFDTATDDIKTWDLTVDTVGAGNATVSAKTNVITDQDEAAQVAVVINQQNDDVYVAYGKGGTWVGAIDMVFHKSINDMTSWGSEQAYSETTDDNRMVHGGRSVGNNGGRIQFSFYNDDLADVYVNLVNDIEIPAVSVGISIPVVMHHLRQQRGF